MRPRSDGWPGLTDGLDAEQVADGPPMRRRSSSVSFVVAVVALVTLAVAVIPSAPRIGSAAGATRTAGGAPGQADARARADEAGIDLDGVMEQVEHHVVAAADRPGTLVVEDSHYRAAFTSGGFELSLAGGAALAVSLRSAARGDDRVAVPSGRWQPNRNTASRAAGGLTERVTARSGEVEWDVVLDAAPAGSGPVRVWADVSGVAASSDGPDGSGQRLELAGGTSVELGDMVVVDAGGVEVYRAAPVVAGSTLRLDVPESVLAGADYPLTIDPTVRPEQPISPPTGAPGDQYAPVVAFDGTNFLVLWMTNPNGAAWSLAATRVDRHGVPLDPNGVILPSLTWANADRPAVAFAAGAYLVTFVRDGRIHGVRIGTDGRVRDDVFPISDGVPQVPVSLRHFEWMPSVASTGSMFLVVWTEVDQLDDPPWSDPLYDGNIFGSRVDGTSVLDPSGIAISMAPGWQSMGGVASDGEGFLVTWIDALVDGGGRIDGARVDGRGTVLDPDGFSIAAASSGASAVAFGDSVYLVVFESPPNDRPPGYPDGDHDVWAVRVAIDGTVLDPDPVAVSVGLPQEGSPAVAFDGTNFVAVWSDTRHDQSAVFAARINGDGVVLDPVGIALSRTWTTSPAVAGGVGITLVVWGGHDVNGTRLRSDGTSPDAEGRLISLGSLPLGDPDVAFNGSVFLVAWRDNYSGYLNIIATRVRPDGTVLDPAGIYAGGDWNPGSAPPTVTSDGRDFIVVASSNPPSCTVSLVVIHGSDGTPVWPPQQPLSVRSCSRPAVAFNGTNYLIVTAEPDAGLDGTLVDRAGIFVLTSALTADHPGLDQPFAASADRRILVAWQTGAVVVSDWGPVTPVDVPPSLPTGRTAVGSGGDVFLLTRMGTAGLVSTRITVDGTVLDPAGIPISGTGGSPDVAFNGSWLIVWNDRRTTGAGPGVYGARIRPDGTALDPAGFVITAGLNVNPAVAPLADGDGWAVTYHHFDSPTRSHRMFMRQVAPK
jgi:hypothetical protein